MVLHRGCFLAKRSIERTVMGAEKLQDHLSVPLKSMQNTYKYGVERNRNRMIYHTGFSCKCLRVPFILFKKIF